MEWRSRRWRRLLNLIDHLPRHSAYHESLVNDEKLAALLVDIDGGQPAPPKRQMREFTPEVELLSVIADRLAELAQVVVASKGGKPHPVRPMPRPVTAAQRLRARKRKRTHQSLVSRMLPNQPQS